MKATWVLLLPIFTGHVLAGDKLQRVEYNNAALVVDLGVGLVSWPVPMDADGDGDYDLIVTYEDRPSNGTYLFENTTGDTSKNTFPVFSDGKWISRGYYDVTPSYVDGRVIVVVCNLEFPDYATTGLRHPQASGKLQANVHPRRLRFNQWRYVDYGRLDLTIGIEDWVDYRGDNFAAFDLGFNENGEWLRGPVHGQIYLLKNYGTTAVPSYGKSTRLQAGGEVIDGYGAPSQSFEDFDGDVDLDLITGEFLDGFTYYRNVGSRTAAEYAAGVRLPFTMDSQIVIVVAIDWDKDGDVDLVVGQENGTVALVEHSGEVGAAGTPQFRPPRVFQQQAGALKFGALVTPVGVDWDGDGRVDLLADDLKTSVRFYRNESDGNEQVVFRDLGVLDTRELARYTTSPTTVDWDDNGVPDLLVGAEDGRFYHMQNPRAK